MLVPLAWAAIVALAVPPVLYWLFWLSPVTIYAATIATFAFLALVLGVWPVRLAVTPRAVRRKHARRCAREQFLTQELYTTRGRTGVLIFVALAERYCEIIADTAIAERVAPEAWRGIIDRLLAEIRTGRAIEGLGAPAPLPGRSWRSMFHPGADNPDELPDHLIAPAGLAALSRKKGGCGRWFDRNGAIKGQLACHLTLTKRAFTEVCRGTRWTLK